MNKVYTVTIDNLTKADIYNTSWYDLDKMTKEDYEYEMDLKDR